MNSLPRPGDKLVPRKHDRQSRAQQGNELDEMYKSLVIHRGLVRDLIYASAKRVSNPVEAADVRLDLYRIARTLAAAAGPGTPKAIWQNYKQYFVSDRNREEFFTKLQGVTRRLASTVLIGYERREPQRNRARVLRFVRRTPSLRLKKISKPACACKGDANPALKWDSSLLPQIVAPSVLRLAILHPGILEYFLPRFFFRASDYMMQGSTYRRALLILEAVSELGWSAEKHTRRLIELGEIQLSEDGSEVETVKKFIRDLRRRHKKRIGLTMERSRPN